MLKATITAQRKTTAVVPSNHVPATSTPKHVPLKIAAAAASARRRLWPLSAFANGSCASTSTSVLTKKMTPIASSLTPAPFFAYTGMNSTSGTIPAAMNSMLITRNVRKGRFASTAR